jgi:hypothetical protein
MSSRRDRTCACPPRCQGETCACKVCRNRKYQREWRRAHSASLSAANLAYRETHREEARAYGRAYYAKNRDAVNARSSAWAKKYPAKQAARAARWRAANPERAQAIERKHSHKAALRRRLQRSGHTAEYTLRQWQEQKGGCAVCARPLLFMRKGLQADHCHRTGRPRGLLCTRCNVSLGVIEHETATALLAYRDTWAARHAVAAHEGT